MVSQMVVDVGDANEENDAPPQLFEIAVDSSAPRAREAIAAVLRAEQRVLENPEPVVATSDFGDTSINLVVRPWCRIEDYWDLRFELPERVKDAVEAAGYSLPCPQRQIVLNPTDAAHV